MVVQSRPPAPSEAITSPASRRGVPPQAPGRVARAHRPDLFVCWPSTARAPRRPALWNLKVGVVETDADLSRHLSPMPGKLFSSKAPRGVPVIDVNDAVRYQRIQGVGGAMTDSSAYLIRRQLAPKAQAQLLNNLFSPSGAGLSMVRLPIGASDYTADGQPYSYDDLPSGQSDPDLAHFSIDHDDAYIVPAMRDVLKINPSTKIIATAWTPPAWMKTNDSYDNLGFSGHLLPGDWPLLAQYFVKFVKAYAKRGIPITAVTPQNEPRAPASYPSMSFAADNEAKWIAQDLRPAIKRAKLPTKVFGGEVSFSAADYVKASPAYPRTASTAWRCTAIAEPRTSSVSSTTAIRDCGSSSASARPT